MGEVQTLPRGKIGEAILFRRAMDSLGRERIGFLAHGFTMSSDGSELRKDTEVLAEEFLDEINPGRSGTAVER